MRMEFRTMKMTGLVAVVLVLGGANSSDAAVVITKLDQQAKVNAQNRESVAEKGFEHIVHQSNVTALPVNDSVTNNYTVTGADARSAEASVTHTFPSAGSSVNYLLGNDSLSFDFNSQADVSLENILGNGQSSAFSYFCVGFETTQDLAIDFDVMLSTTGDAVPFVEGVPSTLFELTSADNTIDTISITNGSASETQLTLDGASLNGILPAGVYHLLAQSHIAVMGESGNRTGGSAISIGFSLGNATAVPEPGMAVGLAMLGVIGIWRRRRW